MSIYSLLWDSKQWNQELSLILDCFSDPFPNTELLCPHQYKVRFLILLQIDVTCEPCPFLEGNEEMCGRAKGRWRETGRREGRKT